MEKSNVFTAGFLTGVIGASVSWGIGIVFGLHGMLMIANVFVVTMICNLLGRLCIRAWPFERRQNEQAGEQNEHR